MNLVWILVKVWWNSTAELEDLRALWVHIFLKVQHFSTFPAAIKIFWLIVAFHSITVDLSGQLVCRCNFEWIFILKQTHRYYARPKIVGIIANMVWRTNNNYGNSHYQQTPWKRRWRHHLIGMKGILAITVYTGKILHSLGVTSPPPDPWRWILVAPSPRQQRGISSHLTFGLMHYHPTFPANEALKFRSERVTCTRSSASPSWVNSPPEHQAWVSRRGSIAPHRRWGTPAVPHLKNPTASRILAAIRRANRSPQHADWLEIVYNHEEQSWDKIIRLGSQIQI